MSMFTLTEAEREALYSPIGNDSAYPELPGVVADLIADRVARVIASIVASVPVNFELRYDGTTDPQAGAFVEGVWHAQQAAEECARQMGVSA